MRKYLTSCEGYDYYLSKDRTNALIIERCKDDEMLGYASIWTANRMDKEYSKGYQQAFKVYEEKYLIIQ